MSLASCRITRSCTISAGGGQHLVTLQFSIKSKFFVKFTYDWSDYIGTLVKTTHYPSLALRAGNNLVKEIQLKAPGSWGNGGELYLLKSYFSELVATGGYQGSDPNSWRSWGFLFWQPIYRRVYKWTSARAHTREVYWLPINQSSSLTTKKYTICTTTLNAKLRPAT